MKQRARRGRARQAIDGAEMYAEMCKIESPQTATFEDRRMFNNQQEATILHRGDRAMLQPEEGKICCATSVWPFRDVRRMTETLDT